MDEYVVEKLRAKDYDELLDLMNLVFTVPDGRGFETELPKMWRRTDEAMGKHLAIRIDGKIAASLGVYPLPMVIGGQPVLFSTVGNVGTHPAYRNLGLMKILMTAAMKELDRLGADASRLGGERQRYNRYGYETSGISYHYRLTAANVRNYYDGTITAGQRPKTGLRFRCVKREDTQSLQIMQSLQQQGQMYLLRGDICDCYDTACSWGMQVWAAEDEQGRMTGYLSASADSTVIGEQYAQTPDLLYAMLLNWLSSQDIPEIRLRTSPHDVSLNRCLNRLCAECRMEQTSNFKIIHWDKVVDAFLKLKASLTTLPQGSMNLTVTGYGTLHIEGADCTITDEPADLELDKLTAVRFLFGPQSVEQCCEIPKQVRTYCSSLLPLPFGWNAQERV